MPNFESKTGYHDHRLPAGILLKALSTTQAISICYYIIEQSPRP